MSNQISANEIRNVVLLVVIPRVCIIISFGLTNAITLFTYVDLDNRFCWFGLSQTVHLSDLYIVYRTHFDLANRLCGFVSLQTVSMDQLYATYRTRNSFLNRA